MAKYKISQNVSLMTMRDGTPTKLVGQIESVLPNDYYVIKCDNKIYTVHEDLLHQDKESYQVGDKVIFKQVISVTRVGLITATVGDDFIIDGVNNSFQLDESIENENISVCAKDIVKHY